ncbi:hypothetical protein CDL15_Pgr001510 [Punica granatum]|nr:hypothetical protein CDL15_Pgr001510 [Punica granatum]
MEIEGEDGSRIEIRSNTEAVLGRGSGFRTADRTVSRRQVLLRADEAETQPLRVSFEVLGKNPVWVRSGGGGEVRAYRRSEKGEVAAGDWLCVSGKQPVWFAVKGIDGGRDSGSESQVEAESARVPETDVDPVKEFCFLVIGHEFDQYPKQMRRDVKDWNWFLEEPSKDSSEDEDEDEYDKKSKPRKRKKRKEVRGHNEDEDWTSESEEEGEDLMGPVKVQKQKYFTRSKDHKRTKGCDDKSLHKKRASGSRDEGDAEDDEEEEDDETLGGFIVNDDNVVPEEDDESDEGEEEEEFIEDDEED